MRRDGGNTGGSEPTQCTWGTGCAAAPRRPSPGCAELLVTYTNDARAYPGANHDRQDYQRRHRAATSAGPGRLSRRGCPMGRVSDRVARDVRGTILESRDSGMSPRSHLRSVIFRARLRTVRGSRLVTRCHRAGGRRGVSERRRARTVRSRSGRAGDDDSSRFATRADESSARNDDPQGYFVRRAPKVRVIRVNPAGTPPEGLEEEPPHSSPGRP